MTDITNKRPMAAYLTSLVLFSANGLWAAHVDLPSCVIVVARTGIAAVMLCVLFLAMGGKFHLRGNTRPYFFLVASGVAMGSEWLCMFEAYQQIGVGFASLFYACGPVLVMAAAPFVLHERPSATHIVGIVIVVVGMYCVYGMDSEGGLSPTGLACGIGTAISYALMVVFNKKAAPVTGLENATLELVVGFAFTFLFLGATQGYAVEIHPGDIVPLLGLGIISTGIACYWYFGSLAKLKAQTIALCDYLEPALAILLAFAVLGETMAPIQLFGTALVFIGAAFGEAFGRKQIRAA